MPEFDLDAALSSQIAFAGEPQREYVCSLGRLVGGRAGRDGSEHYTLKPNRPMPRGYKAKVEREANGQWTLRVFDSEGDHYFVDTADTLERCISRFRILMDHGDW